jgi:protocatechuate 4,5-dioxygenase beta chain
MAGREEARRDGHLLQRPRPELLPRQDAHLCRRAAAAQYRQRRRRLGHPDAAAAAGDLDLSWHIINTLVDKEFETRQLAGDGGAGVHQHRAVSAAQAKRCYALGKAVGQAIQSWDSDKKVAVLAPAACRTSSTASAPASSTRTFDLQFMDSLETNPEWATQFSVHELVEKTGTQGVELLMWLAMRGALSGATST